MSAINIQLDLDPDFSLTPLLICMTFWKKIFNAICFVTLCISIMKNGFIITDHFTVDRLRRLNRIWIYMSPLIVEVMFVTFFIEFFEMQFHILNDFGNLLVFLWFGLVWFSFMAHQTLQVIQCKIHFNTKTVLFQILQLSIGTQFKCLKKLYFKLFSWVKKVTGSQILLCITHNSVKHWLFIYIQLDVKKFLI